MFYDIFWEGGWFHGTLMMAYNIGNTARQAGVKVVVNYPFKMEDSPHATISSHKPNSGSIPFLAHRIILSWSKHNSA